MFAILVYFLLIFVSFAFCCVFKDKSKKHTYLVGFGEESKQNNFGLPVFFLILMVLLACRAESIGNDTRNYHYMFETSADATVSDIFSDVADCLFRFFNFVLRQITDNFQIYLFIVALWCILPIAVYYCWDRRHSVLKIALFVNMSTFILLFSGIRQAMAISLGVVAFCCLKNKKRILFFIVATVCTFIHNSGFMVFFLFPLYYLRLKSKHLIFLVPAMATLLVFNRQIFGLLTGILASYNSRFDAEISSTGAITMLIVFAAFLAFSYWIGDETQMDDEAFALRNILMFAVMLQCFATLHTLAMRMGYYFIIFIPAAMGNVLNASKKQYQNIAKIGEIAIIIFFTLYFCFVIMRSYVTGVSALDTVPYVPFWAD